MVPVVARTVQVTQAHNLTAITHANIRHGMHLVYVTLLQLRRWSDDASTWTTAQTCLYRNQRAPCRLAAASGRCKIVVLSSVSNQEGVPKGARPVITAESSFTTLQPTIFESDGPIEHSDSKSHRINPLRSLYSPPLHLRRPGSKLNSPLLFPRHTTQPQPHGQKPKT